MLNFNLNIKKFKLLNLIINNNKSDCVSSFKKKNEKANPDASHSK